MAMQVDRPFVQVWTAVTDTNFAGTFNPTSAAGEQAQLTDIIANGRVELHLKVDTNNDGTFNESAAVEDIHPAADDIADTADRAIRADRWSLMNDTDQTADFAWDIKNVSGGSIALIVAKGVVLA